MAPILFFEYGKEKEMKKDKFESTVIWHPCNPNDPNTWPETEGKYLISTKKGKVIAKYFGQCRDVGGPGKYVPACGRDAGWPNDVKKIIVAWAEYPAPYVDPEAVKKEAMTDLEKLKKKLDDLEAKKAELESIINS
jgi:hypothetical protein